MIIKKRQLVLATLVMALSAAVFINWYYTRPNTQAANGDNTLVSDVSKTSENSKDAGENLGDAKYVNSGSTTAPKSEYFAEAKMKRSKAHDEALDALDKVIKDSASKEAAVKKASEQLDKISGAIKLEADIEALITAKTGLSCIVLVNSDKCETIVEKGGLNNTSTLQIKEIVIKQTEFKIENITILELSS